jgi:predicted  nucleic acid-binding Zn-ribbon protein
VSQQITISTSKLSEIADLFEQASHKIRAMIDASRKQEGLKSGSNKAFENLDEAIAKIRRQVQSL